MVDYTLGANRSASDMDGIGTDLVSGDTVITLGYTLDMDIDCGFKGLTISIGGTLQLRSKIYTLDDHRDAQIDAVSGSTISTTGLSASLYAKFKSIRGEGAKPLMPWHFSSRGTLNLPYCIMSGNMWTIRNTNYTVILPYGSAKIRPVIPTNIVSNNIQGGLSTMKWVGNGLRTFKLDGIIYGRSLLLEDQLIIMSRTGETFSIMTDMIHLQKVKITHLDIQPAGRFLRRYSMSLMEAV